MGLAFAIFALLFFFVKAGSDSGKRIASDKKFQTCRANERAWKERVTDPDLEFELTNRLRDSNTKWTYRAETDKVFEEIFKKEKFEVLYVRDNWSKRLTGESEEEYQARQWRRCKSDIKCNLRILLANRGHVLESDAEYVADFSSGIHAGSRFEAYVIIWCANRLKELGVITEDFVCPHGIQRYGASGMRWNIDFSKPMQKK